MLATITEPIKGFLDCFHAVYKTRLHNTAFLKCPTTDSLLGLDLSAADG